MRHFLIGLGQVGRSFIKILKQNNEFNSDSFFCVDKNDKTKEEFVKLGGLSKNFICLEINKETYLDFLKTLQPNDFLLDFSTFTKNLVILEYCLDNNIHYLTTADSSWYGDKTWLSDHQHYLEYVKLFDKYDSNRATCVIEAGMNPGLVSVFAKKCLHEIVEHNNTLYVKLFRKKLLRLLGQEQYGLVAKKLKVDLIQVVDEDNQVFNTKFEPNTIFSTWNCDAFWSEEVSSTEIAYSNKKQLLKHKSFFDVDIKDDFISLAHSSCFCKETTYNSRGEFIGSVVPHEEIFSIRRYFTYGKYKPTVIFVYKSCDLADRSVKENIKIRPNNKVLLTKKDLIQGGEEVGVLIQGKRFKTHYFGNYLESTNCDELATIKQVGTGVYCAYKFVLDNPNKGFIFPEQLPIESTLNIAKKYLGQFISKDVPRVSLKKI